MIAAITLAAGLAGLTLPQAHAQNLGARGTSFTGLNAAALPRQPRAAVSSTAQGSAALVYVADAGDNAIYVYNNVPNATPIRVISGLNNPQGLAVDSYGNLYVANNGANDVLVFAPGSNTPSRTYAQGLHGPNDVAVSSSGVVYVTNVFSSTVVVYPPGSIVPSTTWQSPVANSALFGIALQSPAGGDAYVSYESPGGGGLLLCAVGSASCSGTGISVPGAFALAFQYNTFPLNLLVSDVRNNLLDVFRLRHGTSPTAQVRVPGSPYGIAFDSSFTHVFAASQTSTNEYLYPSGSLIQSFVAPKGAKSPFLTGVAVYPSTTGPATLTANLFVSDVNSISAFDTAAGDAALPSITGGGLSGPRGAVLDATGKLFVANLNANSVSVFDTLNGNVLLTTITGGGLNAPGAVALDSLGNLYVANEVSSSVSVFSAANGYAPAGLITGNGLNGPSGVAIDPHSGGQGTLYVVNQGTASLSAFLLVPDPSSPAGVSYKPFVTLQNIGLHVPEAVAVDANGTVYVANATNSVSVLSVHNLGTGNIIQPSITGGGLSVPLGVAVDATGKLYVANFSGNSVSVFDTTHGNAYLTSISGGGLNQPAGLAIR